MKWIKTVEGEKIKGYEFDDLSEDVKFKVLCDQVNFEIEIMDENSPYYEEAVEMDKNRTPWFLAESIYHNHKEALIDTIKINNYLFDVIGKMLSIQYYMKNNKCYKTEYNNIRCTIK